MYESPRMRRLRNDLAALERLRSESSVFRFSTQGDPPQHFRIHFQGRGLWRDRGKVKPLEKHHVEIKLGASYPRTMPEIRWLTPIYHPNISEIGMVCLGGYGTHWVPSVQLDELCIMLWDMLRYHNYDIRSPYNRDAALWVASQTVILFPTDQRPLRDLRAALGRVGDPSGGKLDGSSAGGNGSSRPTASRAAAEVATPVDRVRKFVARYGKVFGTSEEAAATRRREQAEEVLNTALPANPELQALVTAEAAAEFDEDRPLPIELLRAPVTTDPVRPEVAREEAVVFLDHGTPARPEPPRPAARPATDDIVFIE
jgi:ubiquitin-protein ligase